MELKSQTKLICKDMENGMPSEVIVGPRHDTARISKVTDSPKQPILRNKAPTGLNKERLCKVNVMILGQESQ